MSIWRKHTHTFGKVAMGEKSTASRNLCHELAKKSISTETSNTERKFEGIKFFESPCMTNAGKSREIMTNWQEGVVKPLPEGDVLMCWCWCVDVLMIVWCVDVLMCWCVDVLMCWCVDVLMCWCVDVLMIVLMWWCVDVLMCWCVDVLMCWCVDVLMCWCVDVLMWWCGDVLGRWWVDVLMCGCGDVVMWKMIARW